MARTKLKRHSERSPQQLLLESSEKSAVESPTNGVKSGSEKQNGEA